MYVVHVHLCVDAASYCTFNKANTCHLLLHAYIRKACPLLFVCRHAPVKLSWLYKQPSGQNMLVSHILLDFLFHCETSH